MEVFTIVHALTTVMYKLLVLHDSSNFNIIIFVSFNSLFMRNKRLVLEKIFGGTKFKNC